jgi:hypothetical protein
VVTLEAHKLLLVPKSDHELESIAFDAVGAANRVHKQGLTL